jgi:HK97 family phage major capsid protein
MKLNDLLEKRAAKVARLRALQQSANDARRDLTDGERTEFDTLDAEVRTLDSGPITRERRVAELERTASATTIGEHRGDFDSACRDYSLLRAIAGQSGIDVDFGREREVSQEIARREGRAAQGIFAPQSVFMIPRRPHETRVVLSGTTGAGAIPTDHRDDLLVDALRAASVVNVLGATVLNNLSGNVSIPAIDTGGSASWIAENGALSAVDWDINARTLTPRHVGCLTEFSRNMVIQSSPDVENMARRDFARALASALDAAALVGGGANQPSGIGATVTPTTFATPSWAEGLAMIASIATANALGGALGWAGHPSVSKKLRSTLVAAATDSRMIMSEPNQLYGYAYQDSTALVGNGSPADRAIIFGDWSSLVVGYFGGVDILSNPFSSGTYERGNIQVRGLLSADVVLRHEESFAYAADMQTA